MGLKATYWETHAVNHKFKVRQGLRSSGTSKSAENFSEKILDWPPSEEWMRSPKMAINSRSRRNKGVVSYDNG